MNYFLFSDLTHSYFTYLIDVNLNVVFFQYSIYDKNAKDSFFVLFLSFFFSSNYSFKMISFNIFLSAIEMATIIFFNTSISRSSSTISTIIKTFNFKKAHGNFVLKIQLDNIWTSHLTILNLIDIFQSNGTMHN